MKKSRKRLASLLAAVVAGAERLLPGGEKAQEIDAAPKEALRETECRPVIRLVTPLLPCPCCRKPAVLEWREDGLAVRAGCEHCQETQGCVEALVPEQLEEGHLPNGQPVKVRQRSLLDRQRSAQAEVVENWNLHAAGYWDLSTPGQMRHVITKVEPDFAALRARPESEKPHNKAKL